MRYLFILLLFTVASMVQAQPSLCTVSGTLYTPEGDTARYTNLWVIKAQRGRSLIQSYAGRPLTRDHPGRVLTDKNGAFTFKAHRTSTTWVYAEAAGFDSLGVGGVPIYIPDASTGILQNFSRAGVPVYCSVIIPDFADSASYARYLDSNRVQKGYVTVTGMRNEISDSLDANPRGGAGLDTSGAGIQKTFEDRDAGFADADSVASLLATFLAKSDTGALHAQLFAVINDRLSGLSNADSVTTILLAKMNKIDSLHLFSQRFKDLENKDAGHADADSVATILAGLFAKADTGALHAQLFAVINDRLSGLADADSFVTVIGGILAKSDTSNSVRVTHPAIPGLANADPLQFLTTDGSGNIALGTPSGGGGDSLKTRFIDTVGVRIVQNDSLYWRKTAIFAPQQVPDRGTTYDSYNKIGYVEFEAIIGGNILRSITDPYQFGVLADTTNGVYLRAVEIVHMDVEASVLGKSSRCVEILSYNSAEGGGELSRGASCAGGTGTVETNFFPYSLGTKALMTIVCTSLAENITWTHVTMRVYFALPQANTSTWYVTPVN